MHRSTAAPARVDVGLATFYQPFYNLLSYRLQGLEALARLFGPDAVSIQPPAGFFDAARASGTMRSIDLWILDDAVSHMAQWHRSPGRNNLILSVNLSWEMVSHQELVRDLTGALERHGMPADRLLVDVTVDTFRRLLTSNRGELDRLRELQERGVTWCLDGFGAADLDLLPMAQAVPLDIIKLHPRQLAQGNPGSLRELSMVTRTIQDLELPLVAAGVETAEQLDLVRRLGVEWAQGFLLGEPVDAAHALSHPVALPIS